MRVVLIAATVSLVAWGLYNRDFVTASDSCVLIFDEYGHGSGAIVDVNCVLTARHVADRTDLIVRTSDGDEHRVVEVRKDPDSDLALLYIEGRFGDEHPPLLFNPAPLQVGDEITLIGTPLDMALMNCVLRGRVVKIDVDIDDYGYQIGAVNVDMLDCHGGPGCSGGPVLDARGYIRGVLILGYGGLSGAVPVSELNL